VQITFVGESSATDAIWSLAVDEMRDESNKLGVEFVDRFAEGDFALQARMIDEEVARGVDAIIAPFFDPEAANAAVGRALEAGVKVYALLGVPNLTDSQLVEIGVTEASWEEYGRVLGEITLPQISDGATILWPAEAPGATYITGAVIGFEAYMEEQGVSVTVTVLDAGSDATTSAARQLAYLTANPGTDAIVTTGSIAIGAATTAMRQGNLAAGSPPLVGFVTNPQGYQGVVDGFIKTGIWPGLDDISRQAVRDVVDMVRDDIKAPKRTQPYVLVDESSVDEIIPEKIRK
jgi:simple sugar transport system substrate-binding protein